MGVAEAALRDVAFAVLLLSACETHRNVPSIPDAPLAQSLLAAAQGLVQEQMIDEAAGARELEKLAGVARAAIDRRGHEPAIDVLNRVVFQDQRFSREVDDSDLAFVLLPSVLRSRRGTCVGLGTLYLALADVLHIPMRGVVLPGHFFVRVWEGNRSRNVELLRGGEEQPDEWYRARWAVPNTTTPVYGRPLTNDEVLGVVEFDVGNDLRRRGRVPEARRAFERAVVHFPSFPEAQASLGAMLHLEGALDAAAAAYGSAKDINPSLPGLDENIRLLQDERRSHAPP